MTNTFHGFVLGVCAVFFVLATPPAFAQEALPTKPPIPKDNPQTKEKIALGKRLYFDPRLSKDGTISCNSCHNADGSGTDNKPVSEGVGGKKGGRNSPTVWNSAYHSVQFWDGRAPTLEEQAKGPLINPVEMAMENHDAVVKAVRQDSQYQKDFKKVFGSTPIDIDNIVKAIAAYERTLITPNTPFDRFKRGDKNAMTPAAIRGMHLVAKVGCTTCHSGPMLSGPTMPPGQGFYMRFPTYPDSAIENKYGFTKDGGRFEVTKQEQDRNMWRVASWRNVAATGPYFHTGNVNSLEEAVAIMAKLQLNKTLPPEEIGDIVAFLKSLTGPQLSRVK